MKRTSAGRGLISLGVAAIIASSLTMVGHTPARAASPSPIQFATPTVMDPIHTYGEPNVGINPKDGSVYDSGPEGTGVQRSGWEGSVDGGSTFRIVGQCPNAQTFVTATQPCPITGGPSAAGDQTTPTSAPGGGDAEQKFDSSGTQYFADLYALACQRVAYTADDGATAPENALGCGQTQPTCGPPPSTTPCPGEGSDRQWLAVLDPGLTPGATFHTATAPDGTHYAGPYPLVYMEYNNLNTVQNNCSTWLMIGNAGNPTTHLTYVPANNTTTGNFGCDGYPSVDQETGQVLEASTCSAGTSGNGVCLNIGTPDSTGFLHFLDDTNGPGLITIASNLADPAANLFVVSSIDSGQNLHVSWGEDLSSKTAPPSGPQDWQMFTTVASAASGWTNWATPVQVSQAPSNVNIFPWVAAGDGPVCQSSALARVQCAGRSDTTWYGTSDNTEGPSSMSPGTQVWDVYMAQVVWPVDSTGAYIGGAPSSNTMVKVTPHPMQYGAICLLGTDCITAQGNRNVSDFFEVGLDRNGGAVIAYDDNSNNLLQSGAPSSEQAADHAGAGVITIARQWSGPSLIGAVLDPNPAYQGPGPTTGMTDPTGDAKYPVIGGTNVPGFDLTSNQLSLSSDSSTLTVTMKVSDLSNAALQNAFTTVPGTTNLAYVTRWLEPSVGGPGTCSLPSIPAKPSTACSLFYAMAELTPATIAGGAPTVQFWAGSAASVDLCSVSACFPHVVFYPDDPAHGGNLLSTGGTFDQTTGTFTINVPAADVGNPSQSTLLEEVGTYAFASDHQQSAVNNALAQSDDVPFEIDGICCFNYQAQSAVLPEVLWTPALLGIGVVLVGTGLLRRRRAVTLS